MTNKTLLRRHIIKRVHCVKDTVLDEKNKEKLKNVSSK